MKFIQNVHGSEQAAQPLVIGKDTIYVHANIRQEQVEDLNATRTEWVYDEYQFSIDEMPQAISLFNKLQSLETELLKECILELSEQLYGGA